MPRPDHGPPTTRLPARQAALAAALTAPGADVAAPGPGGIVPGGRLDVAGALAVYRRGYVARLTEQLGEIYPSVWRVLGDEGFFELCRGYIAGHPSMSHNLSHYGGDLSRHLARSGWMDEFPFLEELADFEWLLHVLFHDEGHQPVPLQQLAAVGDLLGVRLRLGAGVRLLDCRHALLDVYRRRDDARPLALDVSRPQQLVLYRQGGEVLVRELDAPTFRVLEALSAGLPVEEALAHAAGLDDSCGPLQVRDAFAWIARAGLIAAIER